jgi:hypothetical protein
LGHVKGKPEGLAFTPNGRALIALDTREARENLVLFEPPIAAPEVLPWPVRRRRL